MNRIPRLLFHALTAISLLALLATLTLWVLSHDNTQEFDFGAGKNGYALFARNEEICAILHAQLQPPQWGFRHSSDTQLGFVFGFDNVDPVLWHWGPFTLRDNQFNSSRWLYMPLWPLCILFVIPIALFLLRIRLKPRNPNLCTTCGYDIRATPDRCPECGSLPSPSVK